MPANEETLPLIGSTAKNSDTTREGAASFFAAFGVVWTVISVQAILRWIFSSDFGVAPVLGPDRMDTWRLVCLRLLEASAIIVVLAFVWICVVLPMYPSLRHFRFTSERGELGIDGRLVVGGLVAFFADPVINGQGYIFMFNSHSINVGVWGRFLPFHNPKTSTRFADPLLWGLSLYVGFCTGFGILGCPVARKVRARFPMLTNAGVLTIVWIYEFVLDFIIEVFVIRVTQAYGYGVTYGPLTVFAGTWYQIPLYETALAATFGVVFTAVRLEALETGISPAERGYHHWPEKLQGTVRMFAVIGFCTAMVLFLFHFPMSWFGLIGDSVADAPSYMWAA